MLVVSADPIFVNWLQLQPDIMPMDSVDLVYVLLATHDVATEIVEVVWNGVSTVETDVSVAKKSLQDAVPLVDARLNLVKYVRC